MPNHAKGRYIRLNGKLVMASSEFIKADKDCLEIRIEASPDGTLEMTWPERPEA